MSVMNELRFVTNAKPAFKDPTLIKREKLVDRIRTQLMVLTLKLENNTATEAKEEDPQKERSLSPWWWMEKDGKMYVHIKYGSKVLELQKGKPAILCDGLLGVKKTLETVEKAVLKGELDALLQTVGNELRKRFSS